MNDRKAFLSVVALVLGVIACVVAIAAFVHRPDCAAGTEQRVYERIVAEVAHELAPDYRDFDVSIPQSPETIHDVIRPMLSVSQKTEDQ